VLAWPLAALALLLVYNIAMTPDFLKFTFDNGEMRGVIIDILKNGAPVILVALGMTLVLATGGVDLSVGSIMVIAAATAWKVVGDNGQGYGLFFTAMLAVVAVSLLLGLWNGFLVSIMRVQPIVATLILMVAGRGVAKVITENFNPEFKNAQLLFLGNGIFFGLRFPVLLTPVVFVVVALIIRKSALGLFIESVGDNETASHYAGLSARAVKFSTYLFAALCAGLAGVLVSASVGQVDTNQLGLNMELDAILAAVIGGTSLAGGRFYLLGSVIGGLVIQTLTETLLTHGVKPEIIPLPKAMVVLAVCLLQSPVFRKQMRMVLPARGKR